MNKYLGVYDYKESDTFRPTIETRTHWNYPYSKTLCTKDTSTTVVIGGGRT